jgi:hypothetical protein
VRVRYLAVREFWELWPCRPILVTYRYRYIRDSVANSALARQQGVIGRARKPDKALREPGILAINDYGTHDGRRMALLTTL